MRLSKRETEQEICSARERETEQERERLSRRDAELEKDKDRERERERTRDNKKVCWCNMLQNPNNVAQRAVQ